MSYKIAVASSDGLQIDETFGSAKKFIIYQITDDGFKKSEERDANQSLKGKEKENQNVQQNCSKKGGCGSYGSCFKGGCSAEDMSEKVELISDCRCIVCKKIGFNIQKQLEKKAISSFDVSCTVNEALSKISRYFNHIDNHESLRVEKK